MAYSILVPGAIQATNVDSLVKIAKCTAGALENGNVVKLGDLSSTTGENEVYLASTPATATLATDIFYMVNEPVNVLTDSKYLGLNDDATEFNIAASKIFTCYKPMVGDEIIISEDGLAGTKSTNTFVIPANGTGELTWAANASTTSLGYQLVEATTITVPSSTFYADKITAYKFRCVKA